MSEFIDDAAEFEVPQEKVMAKRVERGRENHHAAGRETQVTPAQGSYGAPGTTMLVGGQYAAKATMLNPNKTQVEMVFKPR